MDNITLTREEWDLLKQVMRTLTWGNHDASVPWWRIVQSVESRIDIIRLIPGQDAKDAARYRWLRAQHWIEGTVSVVSAKSVIPGSECPSYRRLDEWIDRMMLDTPESLPTPETKPDNREPECVKRWPECESGCFNPRCCRWPKSCLCG